MRLDMHVVAPVISAAIYYVIVPHSRSQRLQSLPLRAQDRLRQETEEQRYVYLISLEGRVLQLEN